MPAQSNMDSEREEGEIVDELDDLSDISSEEEFLLRKRLEILENYNNVLERKEAKRSCNGSGMTKKTTTLCPDISLEHEKGRSQIYRIVKNDKFLKKTKRCMENEKLDVKTISNRKKYCVKKAQTLKQDSESSEDSNDEEYKTKRQKLADAVTLTTKKVDSTSLKDRLAKMLNPRQKTNDSNIIQNTILSGSTTVPCKMEDHTDTQVNSPTKNIENCEIQSANISTDDDVKVLSDKETCDVVDGLAKSRIPKCDRGGSSDEDLESLRQLALNTKPSKQCLSLPDIPNTNKENIEKVDSEIEDSDTEELRLICLRSALLKKAMEMKKKQKLQKRLSQHSISINDVVDTCDSNGNNTDVENVDMDIGSDIDEKEKDICDNPVTCENHLDDNQVKETKHEIKAINDELEEDEDLLRAKLLTSLSKNLPVLVDLSTLNTKDTKEETVKGITTKINVPEKKFIIQLGDSDSEGEHEATKNLTKMHMKLAEQTEFQQKLDQFLKSTRMKVEKDTVPGVVKQPIATQPPQKFVPKAMKHLPKSEQIEYKNLVKRMAELEKLKQARQLSLNNLNKSVKETLKPRNISSEISPNKLEEKIASSRKMIAEESAKMLKLKEEANKLSQRYKIVANELRNITTAVTLNKKQQRTVQNGLTKIRLQHQLLLKSSTIKHSITNHLPVHNQSNKVNNKIQKENDPLIKEHKNPNMLKSVKVSVVNDLKETTNNSKLSVEVDITRNKKVIKVQKAPNKDRTVDIQDSGISTSVCNEKQNLTEKGGGRIKDEDEPKDYISPLEALAQSDWKEDPNALLCPYDVAGSCRDTDCKYLHLQSTQ
ncbi:unnamed protein product [Leptosia nina]|uniref:Putative zinc-finger domain-containing protein n=1 Tax=Leptosia nina TaxID=320188 RepID=A0AAV1JTF0_9NEOP